MKDGCHLDITPDNQSKLAEKLLLSSAITYGSKIYPQNKGGEIEVAHGKPFRISTRNHADPRNKYVLQQSPFFFHTENNSHEAIEIDLQAFHYIKRIVLTNRTDCFQERASLI